MSANGLAGGAELAERFRWFCWSTLCANKPRAPSHRRMACSKCASVKRLSSVGSTGSPRLSRRLLGWLSWWGSVSDSFCHRYDPSLDFACTGVSYANPGHIAGRDSGPFGRIVRQSVRELIGEEGGRVVACAEGDVGAVAADMECFETRAALTNGLPISSQ